MMIRFADGFEIRDVDTSQIAFKAIARRFGVRPETLVVNENDVRAMVWLTERDDDDETGSVAVIVANEVD